MSTLGQKASSHIKAMILGYEEEPDEHEMIVGSDVMPSEPGATTAVVLPDKAAACQE